MTTEARLATLDDVRRQGGPPAVVERAFNDEHPAIREKASEIASELVPPERLVELIGDGQDIVRRASAMAALERAGRRALGALADAAHGPEVIRAQFAVQVLARIDAPESRRVLRAAAASSNALLAQAAFEALGLLRDEEAVPLLLAALKRSEDWCRFSAVVALGRIGDRRAVPKLKDLLRHPLLADAAHTSLRKIAFAIGEDELDEETHD